MSSVSEKFSKYSNNTSEYLSDNVFTPVKIFVTNIFNKETTEQDNTYKNEKPKSPDEQDVLITITPDDYDL